MRVVMRMARNEDLDSIVKLLNQGKLSTEGIESNLSHFIVVEKAYQLGIVATAGFEIVGEGVCLLRSLAAKNEAGSTEIILGLIKALLELAVHNGLKDVYLFTPSTGILEYLGFEEISVADLPQSIQQSVHFQRINREISTAMVYRKVDKLHHSAQN